MRSRSDSRPHSVADEMRLKSSGIVRRYDPPSPACGLQGSQRWDRSSTPYRAPGVGSETGGPHTRRGYVCGYSEGMAVKKGIKIRALEDDFNSGRGGDPTASAPRPIG